MTYCYLGHTFTKLPTPGPCPLCGKTPEVRILNLGFGRFLRLRKTAKIVMDKSKRFGK